MIRKSKPKISEKKIEKLAKQGRLRDGLEMWTSTTTRWNL